MRNLVVALVFVFAVVSVVNTLVSQAQADTFVRVDPSGLSAPVKLSDDDGSLAADKKDDKKKKKKKKQDDKDEEDEEDYRSYAGGITALQQVDPSAPQFR